MDPTPQDWQTFGSLAGVIVVLGGLIATLRSLGLLRRSPEQPKADPHARRIEAIEAQVEILVEECKQAHRRLEQMTQEAAAENGSRIGEMRAATGRIHARIDAVAGVVKHVEGQLGEVRRTTRLILDHMLKEKK